MFQFFVHGVPVQISLHIAYQDVCLASWGHMEFSLNWNCCLSCGVCHAPRLRALSLLCLRMAKAYFPKGISERVKTAVIRRLQSAMASSASLPEPEASATGEGNPPLTATSDENKECLE